MFKLTDSAVRQVKEAARQSEAEGMVLRVAAKYKDDGSIDYGMGFDEAGEADHRIDQDGVQIAIDPHSKELLEEAIMDYVELESGEMHFIFLNPNDPHYVPPKTGKKRGGGGKPI